MPMTQTWSGIFAGRSGAGMNSARSEADARADREGDRRQQEGRHLARRVGEKRQQRPHGDRREADQCCARHRKFSGARAAAPDAYKASNRRALTVIVPISVPIVAWIGAYTPVSPIWANVTMIRLLVLRNSSARRPLR